MVLIAALLAAAGCVSLAERMATGVVARDLKSLDQEFEVFGADLAHFRGCLKDRGGTCNGDDTTPLPHTSQAGKNAPVTPVAHQVGQTLAASMASLPTDDPAHHAVAVLNHPVIGQAAALHNHLRGHPAVAAPGFRVAQQSGAQSDSASVANLTVSVSQIGRFHRGLLATLGTTAWESLHGHCGRLLATHGDATGRAALAADCRRVAFIHGYLNAYIRTGEFVQVDLQLAGTIDAIKSDAQRINAHIDRVIAGLRAAQSRTGDMDAVAATQLATDAGNLVAELDGLAGRAAGKVFLGELADRKAAVQAKSQQLRQAAERGAAPAIAQLSAELDKLLGDLADELAALEQRVASVDEDTIQRVQAAIGRADAKLSNVFKVSRVGFVSRDHEFRARLPTLEVTLDPTIGKLLTLTDIDTGQVITGATNRADLGVASDASGVGTGNSIGAEILRVLLEAVFDAHEGLPAVAPANQPDVRPTGLALGPYSLPLFTAPMGNIDGRDFTRMTHTNDAVAAKTRAVMSRVIAGIGPFSLNNPGLEDLIVELITTTVRKATAKATWCWYACNLDADLRQIATDSRTTLRDAADQARDRLAADVRKERERIRLRLEFAE